MKESLIRFTCDICKIESLGKSVKAVEYVEVELPILMEDRAWTTHHICKRCTKAIVEAYNKL